MAKDLRKSVVLTDEIISWICSVQKKQGLDNFSQAARFIFRKAKESGVGGGK